MHTPSSRELAITGLGLFESSVSEDIIRLRDQLNHEALGGSALHAYVAEKEDLNANLASLSRITKVLPNAQRYYYTLESEAPCLSSTHFETKDQAQARFIQNSVIWSRDSEPYWLIGTSKDNKNVTLLLLGAHVLTGEGVAEIKSPDTLTAYSMKTSSFQKWQSLRESVVSQGFSRDELPEVYSNGLFSVSAFSPGSSHVWDFSKLLLKAQKFSGSFYGQPFPEGVNTRTFHMFDVKSHLDLLATIFEKTPELKQIYATWGEE